MATKRVVMFSGGIGSWAAARRIADQYGTDDLTLLFADTLIEDEDLYRFLDDAAENIGVPVTRIADGRTPFEVFRDERWIGNSRVDPCSRVLKRELMRRWLVDNCDPTHTEVALGIDWAESHRMDGRKVKGEWRPGIRERMLPWKVVAPMCERPLLTKAGMLRLADEHGLARPRLYGLGLPHNNCGGACVKAGKAQWRLTLRELPGVFAMWEQQERELIEHLGKKQTILRDRDGIPMTLEEFRMREQSNPQMTFDDDDDWGGCGCAVDG